MDKNLLKETLVRQHGGKCLICGYNRCLAALEFHHINPHEKEFNISSKSNMYDLRYELDKCVLLCVRCHREAHNNLISPETLQELKDEM